MVVGVSVERRLRFLPKQLRRVQPLPVPAKYMQAAQGYLAAQDASLFAKRILFDMGAQAAKHPPACDLVHAGRDAEAPLRKEFQRFARDYIRETPFWAAEPAQTRALHRATRQFWRLLSLAGASGARSAV